MREEQRREGSPALVVLDPAGVDLLELVRLGAQPSSALHRYLGNETTVLLCDEENTPLSELSATEVTHVRPLATGVGLAWSQELRRHVSSIAGVAAPTIALIAYLPPSIEELNSLITRANKIDARRILLCALVSRTSAPDGEVQPSGLLRAITSAAKVLEGSLPTCQITPLAVPWPKGDLSPEDLARAYGATEVVTGAEWYPANAPTGYPKGSAEEIERARNTAWGSG
ncbi:MAG: hypothetical protein ACKO8K_00800, partial [Candidatus Limnocylindrus sp.]